MSRRLTTRQAAEIAGTSLDHIVDLIAAGDLIAVDISLPGKKRKTWRIDEEELERWLASRASRPAAPSRPKPKRSAYVPRYL